MEQRLTELFSVKLNQNATVETSRLVNRFSSHEVRIKRSKIKAALNSFFLTFHQQNLHLCTQPFYLKLFKLLYMFTKRLFYSSFLFSCLQCPCFICFGEWKPGLNRYKVEWVISTKNSSFWTNYPVFSGSCISVSWRGPWPCSTKSTRCGSWRWSLVLGIPFVKHFCGIHGIIGLFLGVHSQGS